MELTYVTLILGLTYLGIALGVAIISYKDAPSFKHDPLVKLVGSFIIGLIWPVFLGFVIARM